MADDFSASITTTGVFTGNTASGVFEVGGDVDWFAITVAAGQTLEVFGPEWLAHIRIYDAAGQPVELDFFQRFTGSPVQQSAGFTADTTGTYYVSVQGIGTGAAYSLTAQFSTGPHPADLDNALVLTDDATASGALSTSPQWFAFALAAEESIAINANTYGSLVLYNAFGERLFPAQEVYQSDYYTFFTAANAGVYYFAVSGSSGTYELNTNIFVDDFADFVDPGLHQPGETYGELNASGDSVNGAFDTFSDDDVFSIDLVQQNPLSIRVEPVSGIFNGFFVTLFYVDANNTISYGGQLSSNGAGEIVFSAPVTGTYFALVEPVFGAQGALGTYNVTVTPLADDHSHDASNPGALVNGQFTGQSESMNDIDAFTFAGVAGQVIRLDDFNVGGAGSLGTPTLYAPSGGVVTPGYVATYGSTLIFRLPTTGSYTLAVLGSPSTPAPFGYTIDYSIIPDHALPAAWGLPSSYIAWSPLPDPGVAPTGPFTPQVTVGPIPFGPPDLGPYTYTLEAGVTNWNMTGDALFFSSGGILSYLTNRGTIWSQDEIMPVTAIATGNGWGIITNEGRIVAYAMDSAAIAVNGGTLINHGDIIAMSMGPTGTVAVAYQTFNTPDQFYVQGPQNVVNTSNVIAWSEAFGATAMSFGNSHNVENSGLIYAAGFAGVTAIGFGFGGTLNNSGEIIAVSGGDTLIGHLLFEGRAIAINSVEVSV
ncbi:MAG: hypothetical protein ABL889_18280, partial [Terricaulis sp.]